MEWVKLGEIGEIITGNTPSKKNKEFYLTEDINFISPADIKDFKKINFLYSSENFISNKAKDKARIAPRNSILVTCIGNIGKVAKVQLSEVAFNQQINAIIIDNKRYSIDYIAYALIFNQKRMESIANAPVVPIINKKDFSKFKIKIEKSIKKQNQISNSLNNIGNLINIRKEQIQAYDDFIESLFYEMFGDPNGKSNGFKLKKLGELGRWNSGGTPKRSNKNYFTGDIPWVTSGELNDIFIHDSFEHINEEAIENSSAKLVPIGNLLLGMYDSAGLKSSISSKVLTTNQAIAFSKLDDDICNTIFVYFCIQLMRDKLLKKQRGVRQKNFNLSMIKEISIPIPPIEMQNKFADYVIKIEEEKKKLRASLDELEILFEALMQDAFSGNLFKEWEGR